MSTIHCVKNVGTGLFLRMSKFDPSTQEPLYGPLEMAWIAESEEQAEAQAAFLGEDHIAVPVEAVAVEFPETHVRYDPLSNYADADEIAERFVAVINNHGGEPGCRA